MNISDAAIPVFFPLTEADVGETNITLRWFAEPNVELLVKDHTGTLEAMHHMNQSGIS